MVIGDMTDRLAEWLTAIKLAEYAPLLARHQITWDVVPHLTEADVDQLGLPLGPRRRLLVEIQALAAEAAARSSNPSVRSASFESEVPSAERRQLTVMFCDLVGSTALAQDLDPEELRELMQGYRDACEGVIARYGGYLAQYLGDGLMVYFGWPVAHEDAAERSVRAALDMVQSVGQLRTVRQLAIRIGLATGRVVVGDRLRSDNAEVRLAVGETPNLAARLQALAGPNEVVIGPTTRRLVLGSFSFTDLGSHELKGFSAPFKVWRVDEARRVQRRFAAAHYGAALTPLVDREEPRAALRERWQRVLAGRGQVIAVGGQAGIGKSRVVQEFLDSVTETHQALHYQCSPYHLNSPLHPFIEQLELAAAFAAEDTPEQKLDKLERLLEDTPLGVDQRPLFAALLSLPTDRYPPLNLSPQKQKDETLDACVRRIAASSRRMPVLTLVEDLHWIDPTSQELLERLVVALEPLRVVLLLTHRPEWEPPWNGPSHLSRITLGRLGKEHGAQIVNGVTELKSLPEDVLGQILALTEGVPLFVEEVTKSVLDSEQLRQEGDRYILDRPFRTVTIPASLRDSLMARLDRLGTAREVAQVGACIGREFSHEVLERVAAQGGEPLTRALERLVTAGLVTRRGTPPDATYTYRHALMRDAAYDSLLKSRRRELHSKIATVLEHELLGRFAHRPELLAYHHTEAAHFAVAIPLWRKAGTSAVSRVALKEAVAHFQRGLSLVEELPPSEERDRLELSLREPLNAAWTGLHGWAAPEVGSNALAINRLAESVGDARSLLFARWWLWTTTITQGRIADSERWVRSLLDESAGSDDVDLRMFACTTSMVQHMLHGELVLSRAEAERAGSLYDPERGEHWIELAGHQLGTFVEVYACQLLWVLGFPEQAKRASETSIAHARADRHAFGLVWALIFSSYVFAYRREPERFLEGVEEAERLAREQGLAFIADVSVPQAQGIAAFHQGRLDDAVSLLARGIEHWTKQGGHVRIPYLKSALAEALALSGDATRALELIAECLEQIEQPSSQERLWLAEALRIKGRILSLQGRNAEAEAELRAAIACAREQQAKSWELRSATTLARLLTQDGRPDEARSLLEPVYAWFSEGWDTKDLVEAKSLLDELDV
jgi:class 3 adenylate cyclase/tetratricopeptide (TPR) repeat protein